ncbi:hypothetical protein K501DRAFT_303084 [Backusella circina FSU 941]|nr:hypothetical protein K501DRAFT_303084 [Backusella circina FSU 941]
MNKLPIEILNQIFLYLNQAQKVECMLVCRHWARTVKNFSLFETVRFSSTESLDKVLALIKRDPKRGTKVERLFLDLLLLDKKMVKAIPRSFPNLKVLFIHDFMYDLNVDDIPTDGWNKNIQVLMEHDTSRMTRKLLSSAKYPHLDTLYFKNDNFTGADIVPYFVNAPALTELYITEFNAGISDYELLHQHLPCLRKLTICYGDITSSNMPTEIEPTKHLNSLSITYVDITQQQHHSRFLQYIGKKYINVVSLMLYINCEGIRLGDGYEFHKDEWNPVLAVIGSQLKSIGMEAYAVPDDFFARLDSARCQIENLTIHSICIMEMSEKLMASQQKYHIETLTIDFAADNFTAFDYLSELPNLKNLTINYSHVTKEDIRWNELLESVPSTVESLSLSKYTLKCNLKKEKIFGIRELHFNNCHIPKNFDAFVTTLMPKVKIMSFEECKFSRNRLNLPQHDLEEFQMIACRPSSICFMLLETLNDKKKQWHYAGNRMNQFIDYKKIFKMNDIAAYPVVSTIPFEELDISTYVGLTCRSLKNLIFIDKPTFK